MKLEAAIHQFKGNNENTLIWLKRFNLPEKFLNNLQFGEFLYYTGSSLEIIPNTTRSCQYYGN